MRIADAVASLGPRALVAEGHAAEVAAPVAASLGIPLAANPPEGDGPVVVVSVAEEDTAAVPTTVPLGEGDRLLVLRDSLPDAEEAAAHATAVADAGLELVEVLELAHPSLTAGLLCAAATDTELAAARTEVLLRRAGAARLRATVAATTRELDRRGERIDALQAEVTELRERLDTLEVTHERAVATRDRELVVLRRDVRDLERSTSYRIGHTLVRLLKDPTLLRRVPGRLLRRLRS